MTDTAGPKQDRFVISPTLEAYLDLEQRVIELEAKTPAEGTPEGVVDVDALVERLGRHRDELEELKRRYIGLLDLLRPYFPSIAMPASTPAAPEAPL